MITLINPPLVCRRGDSHSSGIPYLPHGLAYLAAVLERENLPFEVIDCFGEKPNQATACGPYLMFGLTPSEVQKRVRSQTRRAFVIYANSIFNSHAVFEVAKALKDFQVPVIATENTQAVTGFSLSKCSSELMKTPITHAILGECEAIAMELFPSLLEHGTVPERLKKHVWTREQAFHQTQNAMVSDLDALPWPLWERFPLENYWKLKYAHGPMSGRYVALLTSRGCPYPCGFCSVPVMNERKWRMRSAQNVISEIAHMKSTLGVDEFHWEDLNPTIHEKRMLEISKMLTERQLAIRWRIVSGTKMDNLKLETLSAMADAGLDYVSFSPESGSPRVLQLIRKPFQHEHAIEQVKLLSQRKVRTQACFVLGYPGEEEEDRWKTFRYAKRLLKAGLGEVTYFIVAPMPGTPIEHEIAGESHGLSDLTFSPAWRSDYAELIHWRNRLYQSFFLYRIFVTPHRFLGSCVRALWGKTKLKMEMFPRRRVRAWFYERFSRTLTSSSSFSPVIARPEGDQAA